MNIWIASLVYLAITFLLTFVISFFQRNTNFLARYKKFAVGMVISIAISLALASGFWIFGVIENPTNKAIFGWAGAIFLGGFTGLLASYKLFPYKPRGFIISTQAERDYGYISPEKASEILNKRKRS